MRLSALINDYKANGIRGMSLKLRIRGLKEISNWKWENNSCKMKYLVLYA